MNQSPINDPSKRYDFVFIFDVKDGNPNGDPDAGNLPRLDPETGQGLVTDVCLKRKVRNYVLTKQLAGELESEGFDIYIKEKAVLGKAHFKAFEELQIDTGQSSEKSVPESLRETVESLTLPEGVTIREADGDQMFLVVESDADKKVIKNWMKEEDVPKEVQKLINEALKDAKPRKPTPDETEKGRDKMCKTFYDIRTFGAVMSLKSAPNCGQVRGPVQLTFARSISPIVTLEHSITRMAVATEAESEKQSGGNRTMGRKNTVPYGLYRAHGFFSPHLANQTGFCEKDLDLLWDAFEKMFDHDHSAARGLMGPRKLIIFKHDTALGNAPAHKLFEAVTIKRKDESKPPRHYTDYEVTIDTSAIPDGVKVIERI